MVFSIRSHLKTESRLNLIEPLLDSTLDLCDRKPICGLGFLIGIALVPAIALVVGLVTLSDSAYTVTRHHDAPRVSIVSKP